MSADTEREAPSQLVLQIRSQTLQAIRTFFSERRYLEVETPVLVCTPALELHIDAIKAHAGYLRTSPELHMKRLLSAGCRRVFQMGPCFRAGERGPLHNPEFTMLEWYHVGASYLDVLAETRELLLYVARRVLGRTEFVREAYTVYLDKPWTRFSVDEIFMRVAGWNPLREYDDTRFTMDLLEKVEPMLPKDHPAVLIDFPVEAASLARCRRSDPPVAERWELYVSGLELANAFSELTDAEEQKRRFEEWACQRRSAGREVYAVDMRFLNALRRGIPPCAGVALGVDRLVMLLTGAQTIADVRTFLD